MRFGPFPVHTINTQIVSGWAVCWPGSTHQILMTGHGLEMVRSHAGWNATEMIEVEDLTGLGVCGNWSNVNLVRPDVWALELLGLIVPDSTIATFVAAAEEDPAPVLRLEDPSEKLFLRHDPA